MSSHFRLHRPRIVTLATGAVLSLSLVAAPAAVVAQETPEEAVASVFTAMEEWRFGDIVDLFCIDQSAAAADLDFGSQMSAALFGVSSEQLQAAIQFSVDGPTVEILEQDETTARSRILATMAINIDEAAAREMVVSLFASLGQEDAPESMIDQTVAQMVTQLAGETTEIDEEADIILEDGIWKICSPVGPAGDDTDSDEADTNVASADSDADATVEEEEEE